MPHVHACMQYTCTVHACTGAPCAYMCFVCSRMQVLDSVSACEEAWRWGGDVVWSLAQAEGHGALLMRDALDSGLITVSCGLGDL